MVLFGELLPLLRQLVALLIVSSLLLLLFVQSLQSLLFLKVASESANSTFVWSCQLELFMIKHPKCNCVKVSIEIREGELCN